MDMATLDKVVIEGDLEMHQMESMDNASPLSHVSIGWIAAASLTRDCLKELISRVDARFTITTFDSTQHFSSSDTSEIDLVVYHAQGASTVDLTELGALALSIPASVPLIILSDAVRLTPGTVAEIMRRDVSGFIYTREASIKILISSLDFVKSGGTFMPKNFYVRDGNSDQGHAAVHHSRPLLTPRETEVLGLIRQGKPNKLIAHALNLSTSTTKIHVRNVMHKLGATNRTQAAIEALRYLRPDDESHR